MNRRKFLGYLGGTGSAALLGGYGAKSGDRQATRGASAGLISTAAAADATQPNVLFISIDDLNDWVGALGGHPQAETPNIDALAARGMLFTNAHCAAPACDPSRTAVLTGLRPTTTGIYANGQPNFRDFYPDLITLPQYFRQQNFKVTGGGKMLANAPDAESWDDYWPGFRRAFIGDPLVDNPPANGLDTGSLDWAPLDVPVDEWTDYRLVMEWAVPALQRTYQRPFFMGVGLIKPHLRWYLPAEYFNHFDPDSALLPEVLRRDPEDLPDLSGILNNSQYRDHRSIIAAGVWRDAVAAYLAAVRFVDLMIGELLDAFNSSPHADNTVVVLWSDQGFHLGEKELWRKNTLWHEATRVPLIIHDPRRDTTDQRCNRPVSLLDIYPTLIELCGFPPSPGLEGSSLVPLLENPQADWDRPAVVTRKPGNYAVITDEWRYIRYKTGAQELYNLRKDPNEWFNLADRRYLQDAMAELAAWIPAEEAPMR